MKTSESYLPEGSYMVQPAVRQAFSTLGALRQAQDEGRILEAVAQRCTAAHDLLFDLGIAQGILPRVSCALGVAEGDTREIAILSRGTLRPVGEDATPLTAVMGREALKQGHALVDAIRLDETIVQYIVDLTRSTRSDGEVLHGVSTRAAAALAGAVRARAALDGRDYALPDDVQALLAAVLAHRVLLTSAARLAGRSAADAVTAAAATVALPRSA